jgi:hypothetical protein
VDLGGRDEARTWLTFLRALGLVERTESGFVRTDRDPESEAVVTAFRERVFGAREALAALDDGAQSVAEVADAVTDAVPAWERERHGDWRATYRDRTAALLGWAVLFGLALECEDGYRRA